MKKIIIYLIFFILICFLMPAVLTKRIDTTFADIKTDNQNEQLKQNNYNKFEKITLLHKNTGEIEEINIDEYLYGVVSAEMPASYEMEALKAQAIVARTYTIFKALNRKHETADICDDYGCCQAWISKNDRLEKWEESQRENNWNKICNSVDSTKGKIVTYENMPINAFFHSNSGGKTELPTNVWGGNSLPYLQSVETSGEDTYSQYSSEVILSKEELVKKLKEKYSDISIDFSNSEDIKIIEYTEGDRVKTIKFGNHNISGVEARTIFTLKSTNFEVSIKDNKIEFSVKGYGHGVGMSQTGADTMAKQGSTAEDIIKHFYTNVEIKDINSL